MPAAARKAATPAEAETASPPNTPDAASDSGNEAAMALRLSLNSAPLPVERGAVSIDYIAYDEANDRVWVPLGAGSVAVFNPSDQKFTLVNGFKTAERQVRGTKRTMGPSAAAVGDGEVYIGDRGSNEVCPVDAKTLSPGPCIQLPSPTDGVAYLRSAREVWVTTPHDHTITVLDASNPRALRKKTTVRTEGVPEGYATDGFRNLFFTNLEDTGSTLAVDTQKHEVVATWSPGCGADGPRGVAFDALHDFVVVACTDHLQVLDAGHGGARLGTLETGRGVDNIDIAGDTVYVAAGKDARLTVAKIDATGQMAAVAREDTTEGARNPVADGRGRVYVADAKGCRLLVFSGLPTR
jgi:hypothetical protein